MKLFRFRGAIKTWNERILLKNWNSNLYVVENSKARGRKKWKVYFRSLGSGEILEAVYFWIEAGFDYWLLRQKMKLHESLSTLCACWRLCKTCIIVSDLRVKWENDARGINFFLQPRFIETSPIRNFLASPPEFLLSEVDCMYLCTIRIYCNI